MATTSKATARLPPPPDAAKWGFLRRMVPFFLAVNLGVGVYVFVSTSMQNRAKKGDKDKEVPAATIAVTAVNSVVQPVPTPAKVLPPIPKEEQQQLFKWILEEKRKVKTKDPVEKKKLDEEKALLKEFIRSETLLKL